MTGSVRSGRSLAYKWWVLIAVTLAMFMSMMDNTIVTIAIPTMQRAFGADLRAVQWVVTIYMLTQAAVIPTAPYLTAKLGATRAYLGTLTAFLLGSLLCGFAWNLPSLVVFRLLQGIGGGILLPLVMILVYQTFPVQERGRATSTMGIPLMFAPAFGPVLGGFLVSAWGWPWAFFLNVPLGVVAVVIALRVLRPDPPTGLGRFDLAGFATSAGGSTALLYGIATLPTTDALRGAVILLVGLGLLSAFVLIERRMARRGRSPLLDLRRLRDATFTLSTLALILYTIVFFGVLFLVPIYLQSVHGERAAEAGTIQAALALASLVILPVAGRLSDRIGPKVVSLAGVAAVAVAVGLLTTLRVAEPLWTVAALLALLGLGAGCAGQMQVAAMTRIPSEEQQQVANSTTLLSVLRATAAPLGVTLFSVLVQARSGGHVAALAVLGVPRVLAQREGTLLAMHESFGLAVVLSVGAIVLLWRVPRRGDPAVSVHQQDEATVHAVLTPATDHHRSNVRLSLVVSMEDRVLDHDGYAQGRVESTGPSLPVISTSLSSASR